MSSTNPFVTYIARLIERSRLPQVEMARQLGYSNSNMITMFKKGHTRVPMARVVPLADLLGQEPGAMLRLWFSVYEPEALPDLEKFRRLVRVTDTAGALSAAAASRRAPRLVSESANSL